MNQAGVAPMIAAPRRWDFLATLMETFEYKTFVEVGCKEGRTTGHILKSIPTARVFAIDPWIAQAPNKDDPTKETYKDWDFSKIEAEFWKNVGEHKDRCAFYRMTSAQAATVEHMGSCNYDIVFIDALHDYASVKEDIDLWWPFVRTGGILAFHDFNHKWPGVERAIAEKFNLLDVGVGPDSVAFVLKQEGHNARID